MIRSITLQGCPVGGGTYETDPAGITWLQGPSGSGKSTIARALCAILALDAPDAGEGSVTIERRIGGRPVDATLTCSAAATRRWAIDGTTYPSAAQARAAAPPALRDPAMVRAIVEPGYAIGLPHRELRDLLARATGVDGAALREAVAAAMAAAGHELAEADILDERRAIEAARTAGRARDVAEGARGMALTAAAAEPPAAPPGDATAAAALLEEDAAWRSYDAAVGRDDPEPDPLPPSAGPTVDAAHREAQARATALEAAGSRLEVAREVHRRAERERDALRADYAAAQADLRRSEAARDQIAAVPCRGGQLGDVDCSGCPFLASGRADAGALADRAYRIQALRDQGAAAASAVETASAALVAADQSLSAARDAAARAATALRDAEAHERAVAERERIRQAWRARQAQRPTPPTTPRPTQAGVAVARQIVAEHARYAGAAAEHARQAATASAEAASAEQRFEAASRAASRASALLTAIRTAPAIVAERIHAPLREPLRAARLSLVLGSGAGAADPAAEVLFDGRPMSSASTGERIYADAAFRAVLREAAAVRVPSIRRLPIVVDEAGSSSLLSDATIQSLRPAWLLLTTPDGALEVTRG